MTTFPTLDPELAAAVAMLPDADFSDVPSSRAALDDFVTAFLADLSYEGVSVQLLQAPGEGTDPDVSVRLLTPASASGPVPVLMWMHGGGFVVGSAAASDAFSTSVVRELGIAVASIDYRLAPDTPFPGPANDCYAALTFLHSRAAELGLDPTRIAVGGESAGGCLAAATVLRARDEGTIPVAFQVLEIPVLDDRLRTVSMTDFVGTPVFNRPLAEMVWKYYLGPEHAGDDVSPYAAPARATDLRNLPPTYIQTMELDPLRDEGIEFGLRLLQSGVSVELHSFPGTFHGCAMVAGAEVVRRAGAETLNALKVGLRLSSQSQ